jgi:hypothetical protein
MPRLGAMTRVARFLTVALAGVVGIALSGCAPQVITPPAETLTAVPTENRDVVPSPPVDPKPEAVWPLTGLSAIDAPAEDLARIAIAIKIDNNIHARPQRSLEFADIVFEEFLGRAGATRLLAVFQSTYPEDAGSVRSLRPMDPNIFGSFYGALAFSGMAAGPLRDARATDQVLLAQDLGNCKAGFFQAPHKVRPYATYVKLNEIAACTVGTNVEPAPQQFDYAYPVGSATAIVSGTPVSSVYLEFTHCCAHPNWKWDAASGVWQRYEYDTPFVSESGIQITTTNILILRMDVRFKYSVDPESLMIVDHYTGYIATGGKYVEIRWSKASQRDGYHLETLDGGPVYLAPGTTWVELLPQKGTEEVQTLMFDDLVIKTSK